ncbi:MAG: hypothetical protein COZ86_03720 [Candidatus Moranbacteria bacterium CG_4_8_14_3_um_filter_41_13]|nr:MAG: hypothetical protein AUK58_00830 [Candidatus Moranbacteria bacterium CG2_30_41_165]PIP25625.1 MAG: hypothetical protein COX32_02415 [Candidatus Moranbacteria bacterium CG23_combo_of_CG06-09_8_20_14_all_41_28]PIV86466.1 MAG: hypothetical protein COW50_01235 [Candidatus Moranbacteria bacterium CG17_big_fil_post_rev_8_21_14_2_50_41_107]PIW93937.1 MAG: hypothetical protein COZ86_03720 [Candidatus Moranbacteria bacterium CG_4_8_14_3_um_filter_41_13]HCJ45627.1 hypothetical protein [Candidatus
MKTVLSEEGYPCALFETYMAMVLGSIGSNQYRKLFVRLPDGSLRDVIDDGDLACAYFVSSILTLCGLTKNGVHTTVDETIRDLELSGWKRNFDQHVGNVVIWKQKVCSDGLLHRHIGFCVTGDEAVSNYAISGHPRRHPLLEKDIVGEYVREVEGYYSYPHF